MGRFPPRGGSRTQLAPPTRRLQEQFPIGRKVGRVQRAASMKVSSIDWSNKCSLRRRGSPGRWSHAWFLVLFCLMRCAQTASASTEPQPQQVDPRDFPNASYHEGLAAVQLGERYGYIDRSGRVMIPPRFQFAQIFSEGLARVKVDDRSGYIDRDGQIVISPRFHKAFKFSDGLARVCAPPEHPSFLFRVFRLIGWDDHYAYPCGYIDRTGKLVIDYLYLPSDGFKNGYARVTTLDGREGYIDHAGSFFLTRPAD